MRQGSSTHYVEEVEIFMVKLFCVSVNAQWNIQAMMDEELKKSSIAVFKAQQSRQQARQH